MNILDYIRVVPDFPKDGIQFYDIATLLAHPGAFQETLRQMEEKIVPYRPDLLMGLDSRGFLFAAPLAAAMGVGLGMIRKKGKLPGQVIGQSYGLEYGEDAVEVQPDLVPDGARIVLVDDLLATGGTLVAAEQLISQTGGQVVASVCVIELHNLGGREKLNAPFEMLVQCEG